MLFQSCFQASETQCVFQTHSTSQCGCSTLHALNGHLQMRIKWGSAEVWIPMPCALLSLTTSCLTDAEDTRMNQTTSLPGTHSLGKTHRSGVGRVGGMTREIRIDIYALLILCIKQITNGNLL